MAWQPRAAACSRVLRWMVVGMVLLAGADTAHGQRLIWLGTLGGIFSRAYSVSADGSVVVGMSENVSDRPRAFRWTEAGGMQDLGTLGGNRSDAYDVSADGSVVVGVAYNAGGNSRAFRWTAQSGMRDLGTLGGDWSVASGVSADGSVVVGVAYNAGGNSRAFRWTAAGGMQDLGTLPGYESSGAYRVSADGAVVVGRTGNAIGQVRAFRWAAQSGMQDLGMLGGDRDYAVGVSADGSVVVGGAVNASGYVRAFRWTAEGGMQDLGTLGGAESQAYGVSADGSVVVGSSDNASGQERAFRWTAAGGMQDLNQLYAALLQNGSSLHYATAISPDGRYIVGWGQNAATGRTEAYLLDTQGTSSVDDGSEGGFTIAISPQPVAEQGWVHVRLGRLQYARVEVQDILGRLVTVLGEGVLGEQRWQLPQLAPGVYTVMVRTGHGVAARQFVVTR